MPIVIQAGGNRERESDLDKVLKVAGILKTGLEGADDIKKLVGPKYTEGDIAKAGLIKSVSPVASGPLLPPTAPTLGLSGGPLTGGSPLALGPEEQGLGVSTDLTDIASKGVPPPAVAQTTPAEKQRFSAKAVPEFTIDGQTYHRKEDVDKALEKEAELRHEWNSDPTTQQTQDIAASLARLEATAKNPGHTGLADIATRFSFIHAVNPNIKRGADGQLEGAEGVTEELKNLYNKFLTGKDSETLRQDFIKVARDVASGQQKQQNIVDDHFRNLAEDRGFHSDFVVEPILQGLAQSKSDSGGESKHAARAPKAAAPAVNPYEAEARRRGLIK